jgi:microcin C transport system ATP-binding protein
MMLEVRDLSVLFKNDGKETLAADKVHLSVAEGSWTAIVGESGSGKSVTALSVCGLIRPDEVSGEIFWNDGKETKNLMGSSEEELRRIRGRQITYIFQDPVSSLNPVIKVGEQIAEAYLTHFAAGPREARKRVMDRLAAVRISDTERVYESYPHELSGGMNQRVMIAMALMGDPRLLIADEPTTALDVTTESEILELLSSIRRERSLTILFITHNLALAASYADAIHVMKEGRVIECLKMQAGRFTVKEAYTRKLFSAGVLSLVPKSLIEV